MAYTGIRRLCRGGFSTTHVSGRMKQRSYSPPSTPPSPRLMLITEGAVSMAA